MSITEQITSFKDWAIEMGCPSKALPIDDGLESFFKSKQHELFKNIVNQVRPINQVEEARKNIVLAQMQNIENQVSSLDNYSHLSKSIKWYLKMKNLKEARKDGLAKLEAQRREFTEIAGRVNMKNMNVTNKNAKNEKVRTTLTAYNLKLQQLDQLLKKEKENKKQIQSTIPAKCNENNACEEHVTEVVNQALMVLQQFYNSTEKCNTAENVKNAKQKLWEQLRTILSKVPNANLFKAIMCLKEKQMVDLELLIGENTQHTLTQSNKTKQIVYSVVDVNLLKTKALMLGFVAKYLTAKKQHIDNKELFSVIYTDFLTLLKNSLQSSNTFSESDEFDDRLFQYLFHYNLRNMKKRENGVLIEQINFLKTENHKTTKRLEDHEFLLCAVKQHYFEINVAINRLQYETKQLREIREKILHPKYLFKDISKRRMFSNIDTQQLILANETLTLGAESFDMSEESVFSSTKFDFDASKTEALQLTLNIEGRPGLRTHSTELLAFANFSIENSRFMSQLCALNLLPNYLAAESHELSNIDQFDAGLLFNSKKALEQYQTCTKITKMLALDALELNINEITVDSKHIMERRHSQREILAERLDKIENIIRALNYLLVNNGLLYNFIVKNPLNKFVMPGKHSTNYTLSEYETEFHIYLRMLEKR